MQGVKAKSKRGKTEEAEKSRSKNKAQMKQKNKQAKGITLIALVITIVVLIILATVTISFVLGEDGLIARAQQAAEMTEISRIQEAMELAKAEVAMENKGKVDPDDFFQKLEDNDIINDKDEDVVDNGDETYEVTTDEGYEFEVTVEPDGDIDIEYIGKGEGPRITNINIEETTSSITVEVETKNADNADYTYSYKKNSEGEESWVEVETSKENTCTINGLEEKEIYNIKVKVETSKGSVEKIVNVQLGEMPKGAITFEDYVWQGDGTASVVVKTEETGYTLQYQKNGTEGAWTDINSGETITGLKYGDTVYARLWDGTNESDYANVTIEDKTAPIVNVTTGGNTSNSVSVNVAATDAESGMASSVTYTYYIKQSAEADTAYVAKANNIAENTYTFTGLTQGTSYDVKVEVTGDVAGNTGTGYLKNQTTGSIPGGETGVEQGAITFGNTTWSSGKASIVVSTNTSYSIEYQVNTTTEGNWKEIANNGSITGLKHGDTVYARLTDGTNTGDYANVTIEDKLAPQAATIDLSGTLNSKVAKVTLIDNESGVNVTASKWILNTTSGNIGIDEGSYTNSFTINPEELVLTAEKQGTYYLHVLTKDIAGNKRESIIEIVLADENLPEKWDGATNDKVTAVTSSDGITVPVPNGMTASGATGENSVSGGFVIYEGTGAVNDSNVSSARTSRNQFVWIPVHDIKDIANPSNESGTDANGRTKYQGKLYDFNTNGAIEMTNYGQGSEEYREPDVVSYYDNDTEFVKDILGLSNSGEFKTQLQKEFDEMIASVYSYGGFYIGRYETGNLVGRTGSEPVVVKGNSSISNVNWYYIYRNSKLVAPNSNTKSTMIWGSLWDRTLIWLAETNATSGGVNGKSYSQLCDSSSWGNYWIDDGSSTTGTQRPTGSNEAWKANNIYDLAGNVLELTIEATRNDERIDRGR